MATIESVLAVIERSNLVSSDVVSELKQRLEKSKHEADVRTAVKWLVAKEHITLAQGQRLLLLQPPSQADTRTAPLDDDDELELLPLDDERAGTRPRPKPAPSDEELEIFSSPPPAPRAAPTERPVQPGGGARWLGTPRPAAAPPPAPQPSRAPAARPAAAPRLDELFGEGALYDAVLADEADGRRPPPAERSVWDSPLLLIGGGSLLLLLILGAFLVWRLNRETGDQALAAAEADYKAGSYVQAINKFNHYLQRHESHVGVSLARVHRGMALMRQAVENASNWPKTLETARKIVSEISTEKEFPEARLELAALLPTIAEGLAKQAREQGDAAMVEQSREALAMIDKYVPRSMHPTQRMTDVTASLAITTRLLNRDVSLEEAIAGIKQAVERGNTQAAYDLRRQLLKAYPELASSERLQEAVAAVSQAQLGGVSYKADRRAAEQGAPESVIESEAPLAAGTPGSAPGVGGQVVYALGGGSAWGLDASTGRLLWRRFVGFDTDFVPRGITADPLSDALVVDAARHEVLRVDGRTGEPRWRHPIGEAFDAHPVVLRDRVFIATRAGRLITIALDTGESPGFVQIPQGLRVGPVIDAREQFLYQLGENANLYVLSMDGGQCHQVLYLGHEPESIRVPPLVVSRYLIIAENRGATDSVLRVLLSDENGLSLRQVQADIPLSGHVFAPLVAADRTLVVATNRGALYSFEISAPGQGSPLTKSTEKPAEDISPRIRFPLLRGGQLWIAGGDLTHYDIQSARGRLDPRWIKDQGDAFVQPTRLIGDVLFHVRGKSNLPGVAVSAVNSSDGGRFWETQLAAPPAGEPVVDDQGNVTLVTSAGGLFELEPQWTGHAPRQSAAVAAIAQPLSSRSVTVLPGGLLAAVEPGQSSALVAGPRGSNQWRSIMLPGVVAAPAASFHNGLAVAGREGLIHVLDPTSGNPLLEPFQPRLQAGVQFDWSPPAVLNENELLIADGRTTLYRLGIARQPQPHLVALAQAEVNSAVADPVVALGDSAYVVNAAAYLLAFELPDLRPGESWPLGSPVAWGPAKVGSRLLVSTASEELFSLDEQQQVWRIALAHGPLAGTPWADGDELIVASVSGTVYRLAAGTGQELGSFDVGQPLGAGPVAVGERLLLSAADGTLLVTRQP